MKLLKIKGKKRILKVIKKQIQNTLTYKGTPIRLSADFSAETLQAGNELIYSKC